MIYLSFRLSGRTLISGCSSLKSIVLPDYMTELSDSYFEDCASLEDCILPAKLTKIGNNAFRGCVSLKKIDFPESLTSIMSCAFLNCKSLSSIKIPFRVTNIENGAFSECTNLKAFSLSDNENIYIGGGCLSDCQSLESVRLNAKKIELDSGFLSGTNIAKIEIPSIVEVISDDPALSSAFCIPWAGSKIQEFVFESPSHLKTVGRHAFAGSLITSMVLPETVTELYGGFSVIV